jgi:hypothetical protein
VTKDKSIWAQCLCQLNSEFEYYEPKYPSGRPSKYAEEKSQIILVGFNSKLGLRRLQMDSKSKKMSLIDEDGFLPNKSFMDLK